MAEDSQAAAEDRVADIIFGEEPVEEPESIEEEPVIEEPVDEEEPEAEVEEGPSFVEVEFEGQTYEVPENLKDALLRQSDYTQKTQSLAEQRKTVELQQKQLETVQNEQKFISEIQPELNNVGYLNAQIQQMEHDLQQNLSNMTSEDMFKKKIEVDGLKEQAKALAHGLEAKYKEFEEAQKQSYAELLDQGAQVLKSSIPNWDENSQKAMVEYALSEGFNQQEVSSIIDPRHVKVLWKAAQYDRIQKGATPAVDKLNTAIKTKARSRKQTANDRKLALKNKIKSNKLSKDEKATLVGESIAERFGM